MSEQSIKVVILAGGKGTRLKPYTTVLPKPLMPVSDYPILEVVLRQLRYHGIRDIIIAVGHLSELVEAYFGDGRKLNMRIEYSRESFPMGTAGPLSLISGLDRSFLVMNGDLLTTLDYRELLDFHRKHQAVATIGTVSREIKIDFGIIETQERSVCVQNYIEKPTIRHRVSMGVYVFEPEILKYIPPDCKYDFPDLVLKLIESGQKIVSYPFNGFWLDIGRHDDYERALKEFEENRRLLLLEENQ